MWPARDGVIRFCESNYYWGEVPQSDATTFLREAETDGWRNAIERRYGADREFLISLLDTQRTSWVSLLGLKPDAVALDIGSGYGAITHALSQQVGEVYSLEAVPERVEFTRVRLAQEGISNVRLVQGSALDLPLMDESFDLIVVNGILEWVGEWQTEGDPRAVQLGFLKQVHRLLKPGGVVVIGIENRIGQAALMGGIDHSGVPYTSLMPRWLATMYLRRDRRPHYRTVLNAKREYRTYTYSELGYRRLLSDAGFSTASFLWADPGYNQPYAVVPLRQAFPRRYLASTLEAATPTVGRNWRRVAKRLWAKLGPVRPFVAEFLIVAEKQVRAALPFGQRMYRELQAKLPDLPHIAQPNASLATNPFSRRTLVRIFESNAATPSLFVRISTPAPGSREAIAAELRNLSLFHSRLAESAAPRFAVPRPIGSCQVGRLEYAVESAALGRELTHVLREYFREGRTDLVRREMERCIEISTELTQLLTPTEAQSVDAVDESWRAPPKEAFPGSRDLAEVQQVLGSIAVNADNDRVQHGDFTIENVVVDGTTGTPTVIDWEHAVRGLPPLYDCFSALISLLLVIPSRAAEPNVAMETNFLEAFFEGGRWTPLMRQLLAHACDRYSIEPEQIWPLFTQFLVVRSHFFVHRKSPGAGAATKLLELIWLHRDRFLLSTKRT
jgi:ubiquinone/menaquinone biosynthesis C-methylase UbiE